MAARRAIKAFLATSVLLVAFLCGFNISLFRTALAGGQSGPAAALWRARTLPPLLARALRPASASAEDDEGLGPVETYQKTLALIRSDYYRPRADRPNATRLTYAAIDGMIATIGDRYTEFWTPDEYRDNLQETTGNFVGIGARLDTTRDKRVVIIEAIENSPAARAGILPGDIIAGVNGKALLGADVMKVIGQIKGPEGSLVKLTIERKGKPILFNLRRAVVHTPIVEARMEDPARGIGYISLGMFNEQADTQFDAALQKLEKQGMKALVFDLRNNPGGLLQVAQDLASRFIPDGPIVWVKEKNGRMSSLNVEGDRHRSPLYKGAYPVVLLVNGSSASASEIVAGAIQDAHAATLVGTRTYGKGLVQTIIPLENDAAVKITTQHYFTRDKHDINVHRDPDGRPASTNGGVVPDVVVEFTERDIAAQREALRTNPQDKTAADRLDPQLRRGLDILTAKLAGR